jgi:hypothetical protein
MSEEETPLSVSEQENIASMILDKINSFELPVKAEYQFLPSNKTGLSVGSMSGAIKEDEDILDNYTGRFPFSIYYRVMPDNSTGRMDAEKLLTKLALSLEEAIYEELEVIKMERTTLASLIGANDNGTRDYQILMELQYFVSTN